MGIFSSSKNKKVDFSKAKKIYTEDEQKGILKKMSGSDRGKIKEYFKSLEKGKSVGSISDKIRGEYGSAMKKKFFKVAKNYYDPPKKGLTDKQKRLNVYFGQISAEKADEYMRNPTQKVGRNVTQKIVRSEKYNQLGDIMNKPISDNRKQFATMDVKSSVSIKGGSKEFSSLSSKGNKLGSSASSSSPQTSKPSVAPPPIPLSR